MHITILMAYVFLTKSNKKITLLAFLLFTVAILAQALIFSLQRFCLALIMTSSMVMLSRNRDCDFSP